MTAKYALHPGPVTSKRDGDRHFIDAHQLARLYGVSPRECVVVPWDVRPGPGHARTHELLLDRIKRMNLVHLYPRHDGKYTLPEKQ